MPEEMRWRYIAVLCLHSNGQLVGYPDDEIALALRVTVEEWQKTKKVLQSRGLIDKDNKPHGWEKRQYISDLKDPTAAERQRRYRKNRNATVTSRLPEQNRTEQSITDTEQNRGENDDPPTRIEATQPLDSPDMPPLANAYAFEGRTIRLTEANYDRWKKAYYRLDLPSQLQKLDDWFQAHPDRQKGWFHATSSMLSRNHNEAPEKRDDGYSACSARPPRRQA